MCLSNIFVIKNEEKELVCKSITQVVRENDTWVATDILGKQTVLDANIQEINLVDNYIVLA